MSANDVLADFRDRHGAKKTLSRLGLQLDRGVPCSSSARPQVVFVEDRGFWVMHEVAGITSAAVHEAVFVPFADVSHVHIKMLDEARQADDDIAFLRGTTVEFSYTDWLDAPGTLEIQGSDVLERTSQSEDIQRLWGLLSAIPKTVAAAGRKVVVVEGER